MPRRSARRTARSFAVLATAVVVCAGLLVARPRNARADTQTPVMGPSLLTAQDLAGWYSRHHGSNAPQIPGFNNNVQQLAQVFIDEGNVEGVRGDIAFVQSQLETGWLSFRNSQIPPDAYNYAGIYAYDGRTGLPNCANGDAYPSRCMGSPGHGVLVQIQLLRSYADPSAKNLPGRFISAPSDRAGMAPLWEYFGGHNCPCGKLIWASADNYGLYILNMYQQALAEAGKSSACVPYAPAHTNGAGHGYWEVSADKYVHGIASASFYGDLRSHTITAPIVGGESYPGATGYWLVTKAGAVYWYGAAQWHGSLLGQTLSAPIVGMDRTLDGGGYWLAGADGKVYPFGDAVDYGSVTPVAGTTIASIRRTRSGNGYFLFGSDGSVYAQGDAQLVGSQAPNPPSSPFVAAQRTPDGAGYWMLTRDGRIYGFGSAGKFGDVRGCTFGGGAGLIASPTGRGYWIVTAIGAVIPFGDARLLGAPSPPPGGVTVGFFSAG